MNYFKSNKPMDYALPEQHSLKSMVLRTIATAVWDCVSGKQLAWKIYFSESNYNQALKIRLEWHKVEDCRMKEIQKIHIPPSLKKELTHYIFAFGWQFVLWFDYHARSDAKIQVMPDRFFYTPYGTIDKRKTAEAIVQDTNHDIVLRYKLACLYFLENKIPELRTMIGDYPDLSSFESFWHKRYDRYGNESNIGAKFHYSSLAESESGAQFWFEKMSDEEKKRIPPWTTDEVLNLYCKGSTFDKLIKTKFSSVLWFLFSIMSEERQTKLFHDRAFEVLQCFLYWPYQTFFLETADRLQSFLSPRNFDTLLEIISMKILIGFKDYDYQQLFGKFWQQSHESHRKYVTENFTWGWLISNLFHMGDQDNISLIFSTATAVGKENLIFSESGKTICASLISKRDWVMLKYFICNCISSEEKILKLKNQVMRVYTKWKPIQEQSSDCKEFFQIIDDLLKDINDKRNFKDQEEKPAKKRRRKS